MDRGISLVELRMRGDYLTEQIMLGLKTRSRFPLNLSTFSEIFYNKRTWFMYRLKKVQDLDAQFGRFLYNQQKPFLFKASELDKPLIKPPIINEGFVGFDLNKEEEIIELYKKMLYEICVNDDNRSTYGETTKIDVENVLNLNERLVGFGQQVAWTKINLNPVLKKETDVGKIKELIVSKEREAEVLKNVVNSAQKNNLSNIESIKDYVKTLIEFTTEIEVETILKLQKQI